MSNPEQRKETIVYHLVQAQFALSKHDNLSEALLEVRKAADQLIEAQQEQKRLLNA